MKDMKNEKNFLFYTMICNDDERKYFIWIGKFTGELESAVESFRADDGMERKKHDERYAK